MSVAFLEHGIGPTLQSSPRPSTISFDTYPCKFTTYEHVNNIEFDSRNTCTHTIMKTLFLQPLARRKYLCTSDYNEPFDFSCLPDGKPPADGSYWYTLCGQPYHDPMVSDYIIF